MKDRKKCEKRGRKNVKSTIVERVEIEVSRGKLLTDIRKGMGRRERMKWTEECVSNQKQKHIKCDNGTFCNNLTSKNAF